MPLPQPADAHRVAQLACSARVWGVLLTYHRGYDQRVSSARREVPPSSEFHGHRPQPARRGVEPYAVEARLPVGDQEVWRPIINAIYCTQVHGGRTSGYARQSCDARSLIPAESLSLRTSSRGDALYCDGAQRQAGRGFEDGAPVTGGRLHTGPVRESPTYSRYRSRSFAAQGPRPRQGPTSQDARNDSQCRFWRLHGLRSLVLCLHRAERMGHRGLGSGGLRSRERVGAPRPSNAAGELARVCPLHIQAGLDDPLHAVGDVWQSQMTSRSVGVAPNTTSYV